MSDDSLAGWVARSMELLQAEAPEHAALLVEALRTVQLRLAVDGERVVLSAAGGHLHFGEGLAPTVEVRTTRAALRDLLTGRVQTLDLLRTESLFVRGTPTTLLLLVRAGEAWLHGHLRSPGSPTLLRTFCSG